MKRLCLAAALALTAAGCDQLPADMSGAPEGLDIPEIADGDISEKTMIDVTRELSSDEFEGRMPGTPGDEKTVALLIEEFQRAGLEPGNNGEWVQDVPLVEITGKDFAPLTISNPNGDAAEDITLDFATDWVGVSYKENVETTLAEQRDRVRRLRHRRGGA